MKLNPELLRGALYKAEIIDLEIFESRNFEEHVFSEKFNSAMEKLCKEENAKAVYSKKRIKLIYIIAAILTASLLTLAACGHHIEKFRDFIMEIFDREILLTTSDGENSRITEYYKPTWLPEGFEFASFADDSLGITTDWKNGKRTISLTQCLNGTTVGLDNENSNYHVIDVEGKEVHCISKYNTCKFVWTDGNYIFSLYVNYILTDEEAGRIIRSITTTDEMPKG